MHFLKPHRKFFDNTKSILTNFPHMKKGFFLISKWSLFSILETQIIIFMIIMLCICNLVYKVPGNFSAYSYDHTPNILWYMSGKSTFVWISHNDTLRESRIFYRFASSISQCQNESPYFLIHHLMGCKFGSCDSRHILRSQCF